VKEVPPGAARNAALSCEFTGAPECHPPKTVERHGSGFWGGVVYWLFWLYVDVTRVLKVEGVYGDCFGMISSKCFTVSARLKKVR